MADDLAGGLGAAVQGERAWFAAHGWEVDVVDPHVPRRGRDLVDVVRAARRLRRAVGSDAAVHCHGLRAAEVALAAGVRPFVTVHGAGRVPSDPRGNHVLRRAGLALVPRIARVAIAAAPELTRYGWTFLPHASPRLASLEPLPFPAGDLPVFAWLGRLDHPKRPVEFVRQVAASGARGLVAGDGPLRAAVEDEITRTGADVELLGWVDDPRSVLARAWVAVLLSDYEAVPFALQEAMWVGRAVAATPLPGVRWLAGDGVSPGLARWFDRETARAAGVAAAARVRTLLSPGDPWPEVSRVLAGG